MSDTTETDSVMPDDNELIRSLREDIKKLNNKLKSARDDVYAEVKREQAANSLLPDGYKGLADVLSREVDGDLTAEAAQEWLANRGIDATPNVSEEDDEPDTAQELEGVTDLGAAAAAASSLAPQDGVLKQIMEADQGLMGAGSLPQLTAAIERVLEG